MKELYHIITDGSCDLPSELLEKKNITVVPFYVSFDGVNYQKEGQDIGVREFYQKMVDNPTVFPKTSLPSTQDYMDAFMPYVQEGMPIICICISTKFSGSMQSALNAMELLLEDYPNAEITVIDATVNTVLQGVYVLEAAALRDNNVKYQEAVERLENIKGTGRIFFTVGDMEYLKAGGRIGKVAGVAGSVLGIKPIITLKQGEIFPSGIGRSRRKNLEKTIELLLAYLKELNADIGNYSLALGVGYDLEEIIVFKQHLIEVLNNHGYPVKDIPIYQIGATIGVHTGPYALGIGIMEKAIHG